MDNQSDATTEAEAAADASGDAEFSAIRTVFSALQPLQPQAQQRVLQYVANRLGIGSIEPVSLSVVRRSANVEEGDVGPATRHKFESLVDLFDAAQPATDAQRALVSGYWLQVCNAAESFDAQSANGGLKHLGQGVGNITSALTDLQEQQPALARQVRKSGSSRQARKLYKLTMAGIKQVEEMIRVNREAAGG